MTDQTFNFFVVVEMIVCYSYSRILVQIDEIVIRLLVASFDDNSVDSSSNQESSSPIPSSSHHRWFTRVSELQNIYTSSSYSTAYGSIVCIVPTSIIIIIARIICIDKCDAMRLFCFIDIRCYIAAQWWTSLSRLIRVDCHDMFDAFSYY